MQTTLSSLKKSYLNSYSGLTNATWQGIILFFFEFTLIGVFYFLSTYFVKVLNLNMAVSGTIISFYGLGAVLGGFLGGKLSDKSSPRRVAAFCLFIQSIAYLLLIKLRITSLIMFDIFILGIATYGFITSNHLYVLNECNEEQRLKALNLLATASNLGLGISAAIISYMIYFGFQYIFFLTSILLLILACYVYINNSNDEILNDSKQLSCQDTIIRTNKNSKSIKRLILFCVFFIGMIVSQMSSTYSIYIQNSYPQIGLKAVSILFILNSFLVILFSAPIGNLVKDYNKVLMVGIGCSLIGTGAFLLIVSFNFTLAVVSCVIYTCGEIVFFSLAQLLCYETTSNNSKGHSMGMYRMVYAGSRVVGPAAGGVIYHHLGGDMIWYISGIIGLICLSACYRFKNFN